MIWKTQMNKEVLLEARSVCIGACQKHSQMRNEGINNARRVHIRF